MPNTHSLVVVDVSAIQSYVFGTNDLKHHLGASELVRCVTGKWLRNHLPAPCNLPTNVMLNADGALREDTLLDEVTLESGAAAEVIYAGGGNALIVFANDPDQRQARAFIGKLSKQALLDAPGLNVTMLSRGFDWTQDDLNKQVGKAISDDLRRKKQQASMVGEMLGLGVTADCEFTGLPAVALHKPKEREQRISAETAAKIDRASDANDRLKREIGGDDFMRDFDDFGTKGESSYIAVVHTDGNRMGKRFEALAGERMTNREYIRRARALSRSVNLAAEAALKATADAIRKAWRQEGKIGGKVPLTDNKLPFRPIIFGGDDVTFVCDGRIGLTAAARYLEAFAAQTLSDGTHPTARAGVAIVKTHFPFGRAYALAEDLAQQAKQGTEKGQFNAMDWHFGVNGIVKPLDAMRDQDYRSRGDRKQGLLMRPLQWNDDKLAWRSWGQFAQLVVALSNTKKYPSNKIKALREALRGGPDVAKRFIAGNFQGDAALPQIPNHKTDSGWISEHNNIYFDAIEAMEFYVTLEPQKAEVGA